ncbi:type IV inositol polyphosphate 5-phosphatase 3-like isoform X2 [Iris pallida]|uniref:Type IV inositol polyphosphate 5-phosphatase 3-like isoform X2 n=1 Tax=Iris pallida TaxID=29817 RepID=A0AAX6FJM6_IRIPA|nr:type IV inositol polyphosphate 5-phosphatase 3-like isoform X2 [Iris pallida]
MDIGKWIDMEHPADIYVLGLQEIVPLSAGNIFVAEDSRALPRWERLVRETLDKIHPSKPSYRCHSNPPSPSRFEPSDDTSAAAAAAEEELLSDTDSETNDGDAGDKKDDLGTQECSATRRLRRCNHFVSVDYEAAETTIAQHKKLRRTLSSSERVGLVWPEQSLDLLAKCTASPNSFGSAKSLRARHSFRDDDDVVVVAYKRRSPYVKIVSKQMVGIYLTIWVCRPLRKHVQNLKVSTVGVGIMGYIGNKGSVSVSMSIYQTPFCFICSHLSSGEKLGDELRRNTDVREIHRRTQFSTSPDMGLPQTIHDHERIIWLGDLNYRINLPYERTHELISEKNWSELLERDQLKEALNVGHAFDGWSEGPIKFPPTYKYDLNSDKYTGEDLKGGRRTPAWCDRILSYGTGMKLLNYRRSELRLSDHRPVTATFMAEVEVLCHRKLQKALSLTDAEIEDRGVVGY